MIETCAVGVGVLWLEEVLLLAYSCDYGTLSLSATRTSSKTWFVLT